MSNRYSPYPLPASALAANATNVGAVSQVSQQQVATSQMGQTTAQQQNNSQVSAQQAAAQASHAQMSVQQPYNHAAQNGSLTIATNPNAAGMQVYPGLPTLPNMDMSAFQGVDWGSMYGMGMYV